MQSKIIESSFCEEDIFLNCSNKHIKNHVVYPWDPERDFQVENWKNLMNPVLEELLFSNSVADKKNPSVGFLKTNYIWINFDSYRVRLRTLE